MAANLLAENSALGIIPVVVISVVAALSLLYGILRKFTRMSWAGWQILLLFGLSFLFGLLPKEMSAGLAFGLTAGGFLLLAAAVLGTGALIRRAVRNHGKLSLGLRICDRLLGGVTALVDWLVVVASLGGFALVCVQSFASVPALDSLFLSGFWQKFAPNAGDLLLICFLVFAAKGGYKLGLLKSVWLVAALVVTFAATVGALILPLRVGFLASFAQTIASAFSSANLVVASVSGYFIVALICFVVLFAVAFALFALINLLVKRLNRHPVFNAIDGSILSFVFYALAVVLVCGIYLGAHVLAGGVDLGSAGEALGEAGEQISGAMRVFENMFSSSPFGGIFYRFVTSLLP